MFFKSKNKDKKELSVIGSMVYTLKILWNADKGCILYSFFKNCTEEVFSAFFFVYFTKLIYTYIEKKYEYSNLAKIVIFFCFLHILIHFSSAGYAYYIRLKKPVVYRYIYLPLPEKSMRMIWSKKE